MPGWLRADERKKLEWLRYISRLAVSEAQRLRRVFQVDIEICRGGGAVKVIKGRGAFLHDDAMRKLLFGITQGRQEMESPPREALWASCQSATGKRHLTPMALT